MTQTEWREIIRQLMARWVRDIGDWRAQNDHGIASLIRDGMGDVEWLLHQVPLAGDEPEAIRTAIAHLRQAGAELRERLTDEQDEWTAPILLDVIEKLESWPSISPSP